MRSILVLTALFLLSAAPSMAQMMDKMEKHMEEGMGGSMMMNNPADNKPETEAGKGLTQEAEAAGVEVKVTYENQGADNPEFSVKLDTHSVELDDYRVEEITVLRDDAGRSYAAELASSSGSGHHSEVTLRFKDADVSGAKHVELVIKGLAGVEERVFRFDLKMD